jgi:hypothetical protein
MTVDPVMLNVFMAVITVLVLGLAGKIAWEWFTTGRIKTGEYYMSVQACEQCRQNCCVGALKNTLTEHIKKESWHDSEVNTRLKNIENSLIRSQEADEKLQDHFGKLEKAVTEIATTLKIYAKRSDDRDRRTDELRGSQQ